jgi:N utilization substance protein B
VKARTAARRHAVNALYEAEIRGVEAAIVLGARLSNGVLDLEDEDDPGTHHDQSEERAYASILVQGVGKHRTEIDQVITACVDTWSIDRMPVVDRNIMRVALFELLWRDEVPVAVLINEAVDLAKSLSTEDSGRFVNGVLGHASTLYPRGSGVAGSDGSPREDEEPEG